MHGNASESLRVKGCVCVSAICTYKRSNGYGKREKGGREPIVFGVEREKALLYVAIIETMSVIILRIERQYKQFPYITT